MKNFSIILRTLSPDVLIKKLIRRSGLFIFNNYKKIKYHYISTYNEYNYKIFNSDFINAIGDLKGIFKLDNYQKENQELINKLTANYLNHKFKLLGSDWIEISLDNEYGENLTIAKGLNLNSSHIKSPFIPLYKGGNSLASRGIFVFPSISSSFSKDSLNSGINKSNQKISSEILKLLPKEYQFIDWQRDFRSGYRWNEGKLSIENKYGYLPGVDVKHPWELGRMQHLINFYHQWKISKNDKYGIEFQNQILDFIAHNPPEFGIQWKIAMDPGIRAVNWLIVYSFFKSDGYIFDNKFEKYFKDSIFDHYYFVKNNLEWGSGIRGNHYFANITSIIIILLFVQNDDLENDFNYFLKEFGNEIKYQFLDDGGNFEISLPYHYFVVEMLVVTLYFIINSNWQMDRIQKFLDTIIPKLSNIFNFTISNMNNYRIQNYGDNDSGYFFRLFHPFIFNNDKVEFNLNHYAELIEMIEFVSGKLNSNFQTGIFEEDLPLTPSKRGNMSDDLSKRGNMSDDLSKRGNMSDDLSKRGNKCDSPSLRGCHSWRGGEQNKSNAELGLNLNIQQQLNFPDFGIYNFNNKLYSFNFYNSQFSKKTRGAHQHNDILSFTIQIGDIDFLIDSGTYNYTAFPDKRNKFRSISHHNTLQLENYEQREIPFGRNDLLFWLIDRGQSRIDEISENYIKASHNFFDCNYKREIKFEQNIISFVEKCSFSGKKFIRNILAPEVLIINNDSTSITTLIANKKIKLIFKDCKIEIKEIDVSPNYGELRKTILILAISENEIINWNIEILNENN